MSPKKAALAAHVRRLCVLGNAPALVMPRLVESVRDLVGAEWGTFFQAGSDYTVCDIYSSNNELYRMLPTYLEDFSSVNGKSLWDLEFSKAMRIGKGSKSSARHDMALSDNGLYSELWRPLRIRYSLEFTASDSHRGWGRMILHRPPGSRPFTDSDIDLTRPLARHIAHAVTCAADKEPQTTDFAWSSMLSVSRAGQILQQSPEAAAILRMANRVTAGSASTGLPDWLAPLVNRIASGTPTPTPALTRTTPAGRFVFKAYSLDPEMPGSTLPAFALYIEHFPPLPFVVETNGYRLGLTERQRQMCSALLSGMHYSAIAREMGVRESTVVDHVRNIYQRLDVHDRHGLRRALSQ